jgi:hypothetical protein
VAAAVLAVAGLRKFNCPLSLLNWLYKRFRLSDSRSFAYPVSILKVSVT